MIWLPGVLSQGWRENTWSRYNAAYGPKAEPAGTVSRNPTTTIYAADAYTISGSSFKLESATKTQFQNLTAGKKTVNISAGGSSSTSGSTLYDITSKGSVTWTQNDGSYGSQTTMRYDGNKYGGEFSFVTSIKFDAKKGTFSSGTISTNTVNTGSVIYTNQMSGDDMECGSFSGATTVRKIQVMGVSTGLDGDYLIIPVKIATVSATGSVNIEFTPYTLQYVRGDFIDDVTSANPEAYPENGIQGDYWYCKWSDTLSTWNKHEVYFVEYKQSTVTQTLTSSTNVYRATDFEMEGAQFKLTNPTNVRASQLAVGDYLVQSNGAFTNGTGNRLFKVTKKSVTTSISVTFDVYVPVENMGDAVEVIESYIPYLYPEYGLQDGYWYVKWA